MTWNVFYEILLSEKSNREKAHNITSICNTSLNKNVSYICMHYYVSKKKSRERYTLGSYHKLPSGSEGMPILMEWTTAYGHTDYTCVVPGASFI